MNTLVKYELAKLLKEKGFDVEDRTDYKMYGSQIVPQLESYNDTRWNIYKDYCLAPTIAEVVMWIYEKHGIWIYISDNTARLGFRYQIQMLKIIGESNISSEDRYNFPQEAYETAIEYVLNNLIK